MCPNVDHHLKEASVQQISIGWMWRGTCFRSMDLMRLVRRFCARNRAVISCAVFCGAAKLHSGENREDVDLLGE